MIDMGGKPVFDAGKANPIREFARWLVQKNITPNQISVSSIFFAYLAALSFLVIPSTSASLTPIPFLLAAVFIQLRLLCALFDGIVATESKVETRTRALFHNIPDRVSDLVILAAAGYAITCLSWGSTLGWFAAILAVMTAYIRTLNTSIGAPDRFTGPMAKRRRMMVLSIAVLLTAIEKYFWHHDYLLVIALVIIIIGSLLTAYNRTVEAYHFLQVKEVNNDSPQNQKTGKDKVYLYSSAS